MKSSVANEDRASLFLFLLAEFLICAIQLTISECGSEVLPQQERCWRGLLDGAHDSRWRMSHRFSLWLEVALSSQYMPDHRNHSRYGNENVWHRIAIHGEWKSEELLRAKRRSKLGFTKENSGERPLNRHINIRSLLILLVDSLGLMVCIPGIPI